MPFGMKGVIVSAATVFFAYLGFDAVSNASEEVKNPQKHARRHYFGSCRLYCSVHHGFACFDRHDALYEIECRRSGVLCAKIRRPRRCCRYYFCRCDYRDYDGYARFAVRSGPFDICYEQRRPSAGLFAKVHPSFKTPFRNTWLTGIVAAGIAGFINLGTLAHLVNMGTLAAFTVISIAVIVLRKKYPEIKASFRVPFVPVVPIISAGICLWFMYSLPGVTWLSFVIWIAVGALVYFLYSRKHSLLNK